MTGRTKVADAAPSRTERLDTARNHLADELVRATDPDQGGMDVAYAERLAGVLSTLEQVK
jgi:hypothetical protein